MTRATICVLLAGIWAFPAVAQVRQCAATTDSIARACELDAWPGARTQREPPRYPDILRAAGVGGEARVEFIVDSSGRPVRSSLRIGASHELFATAVRNAFPLLRFESPRRRGLPVCVRVVELVEFRHPGVNVYDDSRRSPSRSGVDSTGMLRTTVEAYVLFDSAAAPRLTGDDRWTIYAGVTDHLMQQQEKGPSAFCVQANREKPPAAFFARWATRNTVVVPLTECPRTYGGMIASPGAPPGWVDPIRIDMDALRPWALDLVILEARASQGGGTKYYLCEVARTAAGWKQVGCRLTKATLS